MQRCGAVLPIVLCLLFLKLETSKSDSYSELCTSFLSKDYKLYESPNKDHPVNVYSYLQIQNIGEINEESMDYLLHVFVTFFWKDERIKVNDSATNNRNSILLPKQCLQYFWLPDIFYERAKSIEYFKSTSPAVTFRVYSEGKIMITKRFLFRASCDMQFQDYPFDSQICEFYISLISPDYQAILHWSDETDSLFKNKPAVTNMKEIEPLQYYFGGERIHKFVDIVPDANYTSLVVDFIFNRRLIGNIINTFIPSTIIVLMSWVGFWIHVDAVPARVTLSVTSLLTLCTQVQQYQSQLPPVNYIKAMDIWLFVCVFFVYSTLLEFAVAFNKNQSKKVKKERQTNHQLNEPVAISSSHSHRNSQENNCEDQCGRKRSDTDSGKMLYFRKIWKIINLPLKDMGCKWTFKTFDEMSQIFYPVAFIIFTAAYWIYYLKKYYD